MLALWLGQDDRGVIAPGMLADIAVFDPEAVQAWRRILNPINTLWESNTFSSTEFR